MSASEGAASTQYQPNAWWWRWFLRLCCESRRPEERKEESCGKAGNFSLHVPSVGEPKIHHKAVQIHVSTLWISPRDPRSDGRFIVQINETWATSTAENLFTGMKDAEYNQELIYRSLMGGLIRQ